MERKALAIYFGCIKFHMYLFGKSFKISTDHKPLVSIFNNPKKNSPFRVERLRLKLQGFDFIVEHLPGKLNPSDYQSRHPIPVLKNDDTCVSDELSAYINRIIKEPNLRVSIADIKNANSKGKTIKRMLKMLRRGLEPSKKDNIPNNFKKI